MVFDALNRFVEVFLIQFARGQFKSVIVARNSN